MNAIVPRIAMAIQTFTSHSLQSKHIQGILMFDVQNDHDYKYQDHSQVVDWLLFPVTSNYTIDTKGTVS